MFSRCLRLVADLLPTYTAGKLQSTVKADGTYTFKAGGDPENFYISSDAAFLQADGKMHSTADGSLKLTGIGEARVQSDR